MQLGDPTPEVAASPCSGVALGKAGSWAQVLLLGWGDPGVLGRRVEVASPGTLLLSPHPSWAPPQWWGAPQDWAREWMGGGGICPAHAPAWASLFTREGDT